METVLALGGLLEHQKMFPPIGDPWMSLEIHLLVTDSIGAPNGLYRGSMEKIASGVGVVGIIFISNNKRVAENMPSNDSVPLWTSRFYLSSMNFPQTRKSSFS